MKCRTFTKATRKTADGRIIVDHWEQLENEEYHDYSTRINHTMDRVLSATRPQWMDVTCACGMRITISPEVEARLDAETEEDEELDGPSVVALWPNVRDDYPDDVKTPIACAVCGKIGYVNFSQADLEEIPQPLTYECVGEHKRTAVFRYVCKDDDCGFIFDYSSRAFDQPESPLFCPCCGKPGTVSVYQENQA